MKKPILVAVMVLVILIIELHVNSVSALPSVSQDIPPIVSVSEMSANASISKVNGELWAKVDAEYEMQTIHPFGDSYLEHTYSDPIYGEANVVIDVTTNMLEAHYPIPLSAKNITVEINNQEKVWQIDNKGVCHIFDSNLPEINWTIQPVPSRFTITVHYEEPIPSTTDSTAYLGQYALVFPLIPRFGSTDFQSFPLYSWFDYGTAVATFNIQPQLYISQINVYSIAIGQGNLSKIDYSTGNSAELLQFKISGNGAQILFQRYSWNGNLASNDPTIFPYGAVVTMNAQTYKSTFPNLAVLILVCVILAVIGVGVGLLRYRRHRKTPKA